jgi:hypothetical protein
VQEAPRIKGVSLLGMPEGSPGMIGHQEKPFTIFEISNGELKVFAVD